MYRNGSSRINTNYSSFDEMKFPDGVNFCIKCKNADTVVKNGKRNGRQRYKCKECNATFTATTDTVMLNTRKTSDVWEKFIWCMLQKYSIRKTAEICGIHRNTAFMWRHKILNILRLTDDTKLSGIIEADETYIRRSCKGNHSKDKNFKFPNGRTQARKRGYGNHTQGLSKEMACVPCGADRAAYVFAKMSGIGKASIRNLEEALSETAQEQSWLYADELSSYRKFAAHHELQLKTKVSQRNKNDNYHLNTVNSFHSAIKRFVYYHFKGVSTKYLNNYLIWCCWVDRKQMEEELKLNVIFSCLGAEKLDCTQNRM